MMKVDNMESSGVHLCEEIMLLYHYLSPNLLESETYSWVCRQKGKSWKSQLT